MAEISPSPQANSDSDCDTLVRTFLDLAEMYKTPEPKKSVHFSGSFSHGWTGESESESESDEDRKPLDLRPREPADRELFRNLFRNPTPAPPVRGSVRQVLSPNGAILVTVGATQLKSGEIIEVPIKSEVSLPEPVDHTSHHYPRTTFGFRPLPPAPGRRIRQNSRSPDEKSQSAPKRTRKATSRVPTKWSAPSRTFNTRAEALEFKNNDPDFNWKRSSSSTSPPAYVYVCHDNNCPARIKLQLDRATTTWSLLESEQPHCHPHLPAPSVQDEEVTDRLHQKLKENGGKTAAVRFFPLLVPRDTHLSAWCTYLSYSPLSRVRPENPKQPLFSLSIGTPTAGCGTLRWHQRQLNSLDAPD